MSTSIILSIPWSSRYALPIVPLLLAFSVNLLLSPFQAFRTSWKMSASWGAVLALCFTILGFPLWVALAASAFLVYKQIQKQT